MRVQMDQVQWELDPFYEAVHDASSPEAKVAASFRLAPHFSSRAWIAPMERVHALEAEYLVVDTASLLPRDRTHMPALLRQFEPAAAGLRPAARSRCAATGK